jgi:hypothetical protein
MRGRQEDCLVPSLLMDTDQLAASRRCAGREEHEVRTPAIVLVDMPRCVVRRVLLTCALTLASTLRWHVDCHRFFDECLEQH